MRGFFGIGISHGKTAANLGTLWRSAHLLGADFIFTIGARYHKQASDTMKSWKSVPLWHFDSFGDLKAHMPRESLIVGVELHELACPVEQFSHPERAVYLLGAEDHGLTAEEIAGCHRLVQLPGERSMNVASAGTVVMYDRHLKARKAA
jgi:tRNA G18 (ribose-2'-O)-methylase SpoU